MAITGTDKVSLEILRSLEKGNKVKDIPSRFPVSLDQAKRLSRYHNLLNKAKMHMSVDTIEKIHMLGLKTLALSPLFKSDDWEGMVEILSSVDSQTTRKELLVLMQALDEKRNRISEFKQEIDLHFKYLVERQEEFKQLEATLKDTQMKMEEETHFLSKYPEKARVFLTKHLGVFENELVLAQRLDSNW